MRFMSFALTTPQVLARTKTVTRRLRWWTRTNVARGTDYQLLQPIEKGQGLKKGQKVVKVGGPIRVLRVTRERLDAITPDDVVKEGFPGMTPFEFITMFRQHNGCLSSDLVTRIEFEYVLSPAPAAPSSGQERA